MQQPAQWADLPDDGGFEWAPIAPYWAVLWRSGLALARHLAREDLTGMRVIEFGLRARRALAGDGPCRCRGARH